MKWNNESSRDTLVTSDATLFSIGEDELLIVENQGQSRLLYGTTSGALDGVLAPGDEEVFSVSQYLKAAGGRVRCGVRVTTGKPPLPRSAASRDEAPPNVLSFMDSPPDGTTSDSDALDLAVARAVELGHGSVLIPSSLNVLRLSRPLTRGVNWVAEGRHALGTRLKATSDFDGHAMIDLSDGTQSLRSLASLRLDCNAVPGLSAIASLNDATGGGLSDYADLHIIGVAPGPVALLAEEVTLGGTQTFEVDYDGPLALADAFRPGTMRLAGSSTAPTITAVDEENSTLTVTGGAGTFAAGHAIERPTYAIETGPNLVADSGALVGSGLHEIAFNGCAHMLKVATTGGDDLYTTGLRYTNNETAGATTTLASDFDADNDTTVSVASGGALRACGRVVIDDDGTPVEVWYTGRTGGTLTGIYTPATGVIASGETVEQFNRPIDAPLHVDGVNVHIGGTNYWNIGASDEHGFGGTIVPFAKAGGQRITIDHLFLESRVGESNLTHFVLGEQPGLELTIRSLSLGVTDAPDWVALVRLALGSPMSAGQQKNLRVEDVTLCNALDVVHESPIVDVFAGSDAVSNTNRLNLRVSGADCFDALGRFGVSSTTGTTGIVRLLGDWRGKRLNDNLACLTANADWPELIHDQVLDGSTSPEAAVTARMGSTLTIRNFASSSIAAFFRKYAQSGSSGWIGDLFGTGTPTATTPTGSIFRDYSLGALWTKYAAAWRLFQPVSQFTNPADADATLTPFTSAQTQVYTGTLTADRTITLSTTNAVAGMTWKIVRTGAGAFVLNVGTGPLKALAQNTWCEVTYNGSAWALTAYGAL